MPLNTQPQQEAISQRGSSANGTGSTDSNSVGSATKTSPRKAAANRANAQKSTGPRTDRGVEQVAKNLPAATVTRLLGLADARILKLEPGAAEQLYRKLIAPYEPAPALVALHFQDLARLQLELQGLERIRDAQLEHRAQQIALKVRRLYRDMDRELGVPPKDLFEKGLWSIPDSPAKFKMQCDALAVLKAQLISIDCQRLMDPQGEPFSDEDLTLLLRLVEREMEDAMDGYELELDERTKTGEARMAELAPTAEDRWLNAQIDRLRRAVDRKQRVITGLLQTLKPLEKRELGMPAKGAGAQLQGPQKKGTPHPPMHQSQEVH